MARASPPESTISGGQPSGLCGQFISSFTTVPPYCGCGVVAEEAVVVVEVATAGLLVDGAGAAVEEAGIEEVDVEKVEVEGVETEGVEVEEVEVLELQPTISKARTITSANTRPNSFFIASSLKYLICHNCRPILTRRVLTLNWAGWK